MQFEFDEMGFKDEIELMNIQRQMQQNQMNNNQTIGFNMDTLYNLADNDETKQ
ncbi:MAG: hypothetical protein ACI4VH_04180 [Clostridia bacterium]